MTERPILFSGPMVRALLSGAKTQTRRVVKPQPVIGDGGCWYPEPPRNPSSTRARHYAHEAHLKKGLPIDFCPYGAPGDRLWVRETWGLHRPQDITDWMRGPIKERDPRTFWDVAYRADYGLGQMYREPDADVGFWRPSIHMPRWASRIVLEVAGVRVERLNDISEADAKAEGIERVAPGEWLNYDPTFRRASFPDSVMSFRSLWESINGAGSWATNPWAWVVEFKRVTP